MLRASLADQIRLKALGRIGRAPTCFCYRYFQESRRFHSTPLEDADEASAWRKQQDKNIRGPFKSAKDSEDPFSKKKRRMQLARPPLASFKPPPSNRNLSQQQDPTSKSNPEGEKQFNEIMQKFFSNGRPKAGGIRPESQTIGAGPVASFRQRRLEQTKSRDRASWPQNRPIVDPNRHRQSQQSILRREDPNQNGTTAASGHFNSPLGGSSALAEQAGTADALRRTFLPNSERSARPQQRFQSRPVPQSNQRQTNVTPSNVASLRAALFKKPDQRQKKKAPASGNASKTGFKSPLSEFIRSMQMKHAKEKAKKKENDLNLTKITDTPLPKWRLAPSPSNLREMRKREYEKRGGKPVRRPDDFTRKRKEPKKQHVYVDPKEQLVTLPPHDVSLTEASLILREKASNLRNVLKNLDELPEGKADDDIMIDVDVMELVALEVGANFKRTTRRHTPKDEEILLQRRAAAEEATTQAGESSYESFAPRPPVVCIMGHVDHGKTTLMDALRRRSQGSSVSGKGKKKKTKKAKKGKSKADGNGDVAGTEAGGITQVISAFQVPLAEHEIGAVTFLDTPGHAAFKAMRQSGSDAADIIVLVVAADDGVSEQTIEILDFYKSIVKGSNGGISMVVAMNKIDKPGVDVEEARRRIESQLLEHGILTEGMPSSEDGEFGPPVQLIPVSGLTGAGLDDLIEGLVLQSEVMDLRADDSARAEGIVMDARVDKGLGVVADVIIRWGSMEKGDIVVSGVNSGKVRILKDFNNKQIKNGLPSQPVRIIGFESLPKAGDPLVCVADDEIAEELVTRRKAASSTEAETPVAQTEAELQSAGKHMMNYEWKENLENKYGIETDEDAPIRIPVIVKADADGTLAAIRECLINIGEESSHNLLVDPVKIGVGPVLATDVQMAKECSASIVCFNIKNEQAIANMAEEEGVTLLRNDVIYRLLEAAKDEFAKYLPAVPVEVVHGRAKVQAVYDIGGVDSKVAGLQVIDGTLYKDKTKGEEGPLKCQFRIIRDGEAIAPESALQATSLKRFKEDVDEVGRGKECGLSLEGHNDFQEGDVIECFSIDMKREFV